MTTTTTTSRRHPLGALALSLLVAIFLVGCKRSVDKAHMDAAGAWSTAMCKCAEKSKAEAHTCAAALPEPGMGEGPAEFPANVFTTDSMRAFDEVTAIGLSCKMKTL